MEEIINEALIWGVGLPLATAIIFTGAIRFLFGSDRGKIFASSAIAIGFLVTFTALRGWPEFPPVGSTGKLAYLVLAGAVGGVLADFMRTPRRLQRIIAVLWPGVIVCWIAWRQVQSPTLALVVTIAILWILGAAIFWRLFEEDGPTPHATVTFLAATVGAAAIAFIGSAASTAQLYGVFAAATGGFLLWNWPTPRYKFGSAAVLGAGGGFLSLATIIVMFTEASQLAFIFIAPVFAAPFCARYFGLNKGEELGPIVTGLISLVPVVVGVGIAYGLVQQ